MGIIWRWRWRRKPTMKARPWMNEVSFHVEPDMLNRLAYEPLTATRQRRQVMRLLANSELGRLFFTTARAGDVEDEDHDDDADADFHPLWARRRRRQRPDPNRFPKVPSDVGRKLMISGTFGVDDIRTARTDDRTPTGKKKKLTLRILQRELAQENHSRQRLNHKLMAQVGGHD
jgi:WD repeat-containing protein 23